MLDRPFNKPRQDETITAYALPSLLRILARVPKDEIIDRMDKISSVAKTYVSARKPGFEDVQASIKAADHYMQKGEGYEPEVQRELRSAIASMLQGLTVRESSRKSSGCLLSEMYEEAELKVGDRARGKMGATGRSHVGVITKIGADEIIIKSDEGRVEKFTPSLVSRMGESTNEQDTVIVTKAVDKALGVLKALKIQATKHPEYPKNAIMVKKDIAGNALSALKAAGITEAYLRRNEAATSVADVREVEDHAKRIAAEISDFLNRFDLGMATGQKGYQEERLVALYSMALKKWLSVRGWKID